MSAAVTAYKMPDNATDGGPSATRPVDLVHLARQTMGDKELEVEILSLFARQARAALTEMGEGSIPAATVAHRIRGAANAVGAFKVAAVAGEIEAGQDDAASISRFGAAVIEAENFINKLCR